MKNKTVLVIAAHPDDELLGCGGTVAQLVQKGFYAATVILGEGATARRGAGKSDVAKLRAQARQAGRVLGVGAVHFENFPDNRFDSVPRLNIIRKVEKYIKKYSPDIVLTHFADDLNIDHRRTFEAVITACRPQPGVPLPDIYCFETPSATDFGEAGRDRIFSPNVFVDISRGMGLKLEALKCYTSEMREYPHSRSLQGVKLLAQYRGMRAGQRMCEAFQLVRRVSPALI